MTEHLDILSAIDGAEALSVDGSPVDTAATTLLGRLPAPAPGEEVQFPPTPDDEMRETLTKRRRRKAKPGASSGGGESRIEGEEDDQPAREPRDMGYSVEAMNGEYALVLTGSKAVVMVDNPEAPIADRHKILSLEAFHIWHANRPTEIRVDGTVKATTWSMRWVRDRMRRQFSGVCFHPNPDGAPTPRGYLNLWRGFSVEPKQKTNGYAKFKDHIFTNICESDPELYRYLFAWAADMLQDPRHKKGTAVVMRGKMGVGKSIFGEVVGSLIRDHYRQVSEPRYVTGAFNSHLASTLLLQAEEAVWAGDKVAEGKLKDMVTSGTQQIEYKGVDPIQVASYVRILMTSNESWVVPAGKDERRYFVLDVSDRCKENHEYFGEIHAELADGGREALLWDLLHFDLTGINLRSAPKTKALLEQKIRTLSSVESWWFEMLKDGHTPKSDKWESDVPRATLFDDYLAKSDQIGVKRRAAQTEMGIDLRKVCPEIGEARPSWATERGMERTRVYRLPPLDTCREAFEAALGQPVDWGDDNGGEGRSEGVERDPSDL